MSVIATLTKVRRLIGQVKSSVAHHLARAVASSSTVSRPANFFDFPDLGSFEQAPFSFLEEAYFCRTFAVLYWLSSIIKNDLFCT